MNRRSFFGLVAAAFGAKKLPAVVTYLLHDPETGIKTTISANLQNYSAEMERLCALNAEMERLCALRRPIVFHRVAFTAAPRKIGDTMTIRKPARFRA